MRCRYSFIEVFAFGLLVDIRRGNRVLRELLCSDEADLHAHLHSRVSKRSRIWTEGFWPVLLNRTRMELCSWTPVLQLVNQKHRNVHKTEGVFSIIHFLWGNICCFVQQERFYIIFRKIK